MALEMYYLKWVITYIYLGVDEKQLSHTNS